MNPENFGKVAVLYGGLSAEREVSLRSGAAVLEALQNQDVNAVGIDATGYELVNALRVQKIDRCLIMFHGTYGEDGVVQGLLEGIGIPYTGCGILASALGMDKLATKRLWQCLDLKTPQYRKMKDADDIADLKFPLAIKPHNQGSSVGVYKAHNKMEAKKSYHLAKRYGEVMAEEWVEGKELAVSIVGDQVLPSIWIEPKSEFYDYDAKYEGGTTYHCPSGLNSEQETQVRNIAQEAFYAVGGSGWGRVDFILDAGGVFWLIEVNTVPGMTDLSLVPQSAREQGWSYEQLVLKILETSL
tara:strand:+ start:270 stop:1166 length:897 start_codon:yes stop_codon:yes gene_type:complete